MNFKSECTEIIAAVEKKYAQEEKLSFFPADHTLSIYRKNKLIRVSSAEMVKLLALNRSLLKRGRSEYDIIAEYLLNKLSKKNKPFPDLKEYPLELSEKEGH